MNDAFTKLHRNLGRAAAVLLWAATAMFLLALACALIGLPNAVASFRSVSLALAIGFLLTLLPFIAMSLAAAFMGWLDHRRNHVV